MESQCLDGADLDHTCVDAITPAMTPTAPFCMAAVLHGRPGLGPESGPGRKRGGMNWKAKLM